MVILEQINSKEAQNIQWVIKVATKKGCIRTLDEAVEKPGGAVIVAKIRDIQPLVNGDSKLEIRSVRHLLLKEVFKDGTYGNKFKAILFGDVAVDTDKVNMSIGDRLIFVQPSITVCSMFDRRADIHKYQLECGLPYYKDQRLIVLIKKFTDDKQANVSVLNSTSSEPLERLANGVNNKPSENCAMKDNDKDVDPHNIQEIPKKVNQTFTESFPEGKEISGPNFNVFRSGFNHIITSSSIQKISDKNNYIYKKIKDIKEVEFKVNAYVVVSEILRIRLQPQKQKKNVILKGVDETCKGMQHIVVNLMLEEDDIFCKQIRPNTILRLHRMKVDYHDGNLRGLVFKGTDILIFPFKKKTNFVTTSAKTFTFTAYDNDRVQELWNWVKDVYVPSQISREVVWQSLNTVKPDETFQMHCLVEGKSQHPVTNTLVLHVSDGFYCPLRLYKVPVTKDHWVETPHLFITGQRIVDVIFQNPSEKLLKLETGRYIVLGPLKLLQYEIDTSDPNCYKMELQDEKNIKFLGNLDPAVKKIKQRFTLNPEKKPCSELQSNKNNQKEGVKEKRKLFYINDRFDHSESKRKKSELSESAEIMDITACEEQNKPSKDIRIKSPFEDEMFNFTQIVSTDVYSDQLNKNNNSQVYVKSFDSNTSKQMMNLKRKNSGNEIHVVSEINESAQPPAKEPEEAETSDKNALINELKTKRIDTMSQESVDKYFEELGSMLTKYVQPKSKQPSPGADATRSVPKENPKTDLKEVTNKNVKDNPELHNIPSSSSSSSVILIDETEAPNKSFDKSKCLVNEDKDKIVNDKHAKTLVIKLVQLPPGKKSRVIMKDNMVQVEMDDAKEITLLSLLESQLINKNNATTSPITSEDRNCTRCKENNDCQEKNHSMLGKTMTDICESRIKKQNVDIPLTDQFMLKELKTKNLLSENNSNITNSAVKKNANAQSLMCLNSVKSNNQKTSVDDDMSDACTVINEKVQKKNVDIVSMASQTMKNNEDMDKHEVVIENHSDESFHSLNTVKNWLESTDFSSPPLIKDKDMSVQHFPNSASPKSVIKESLERPLEDIFHPSFSLTQLRVFLMDVQPRLKEDPMDLASGYCFSGCHKLYLLSTLLCGPTLDDVICPRCYAKGEKKRVQLMFALELIVMDQEGHQLTVLLFREHAEEFLGCTISSYINSVTTRTRVIQMLSRLKYDIKKTDIPSIIMCVYLLGSQIFAKNTKIVQ